MRQQQLMKAYHETQERARVILDERYKECDENGHKKPCEDLNLCGYCHRRLEHNTETGRILTERINAPWQFGPYDASLMIPRENQEVATQKDQDREIGLCRIIDEYNL